MRDQDLAEACNKELGTDFTAKRMKAFRYNHGYKNGMRQWSSDDYWKYQNKWPRGMYEYIRDNSHHVRSKDMAERVNEKFGTSFTETSMKQFRVRNKISCGVKGWQRVDVEPGNKGHKEEEYCTPEQLERIKGGQFKKGNIPVNWVPVGSITVTNDGDVFIKLRDGGKAREGWEYLSRHIWKQHHGEIPDGMKVVFKDNNSLNCSIDNLMLVTQGELASMNRHGYKSSFPDVTEAGLGLIRLRNKSKSMKERKGQKNDNHRMGKTETREGEEGNG